MRAIVDINGKQYEIEEGRYVRIDSYAADVDQEVVLGNVCMIMAGEQSVIGAPFVDGATVKVKVKRHSRGPKILVYKMRCKKGYRRKNGHRQGFTELQVELLDFPGKAAIAPKEEVKQEAPAKAPMVEKPAQNAPEAQEVKSIAPQASEVPPVEAVEVQAPVTEETQQAE